MTARSFPLTRSRSWIAATRTAGSADASNLALTLQNIARYEADVTDPGSVYKDPEFRASYLRMYGNICFDSRDKFVNFPWSSERK